MQILKESIEASKTTTSLGHANTKQNIHDGATESFNLEASRIPIEGATAAPPRPTTPVERTTPEANTSQQFYMEDIETPVAGDPLNESAMEKLRQLLNNSGQKGAKIKFTVDMEEKERDGRSGLRIDVWEVRTSSPASLTTTRPPYKDIDSLVTPISDKVIPRTERSEVEEEVRENTIPPLGTNYR